MTKKERALHIERCKMVIRDCEHRAEMSRIKAKATDERIKIIQNHVALHMKLNFDLMMMHALTVGRK